MNRVEPIRQYRQDYRALAAFALAGALMLPIQVLAGSLREHLAGRRRPLRR